MDNIIYGQHRIVLLAILGLIIVTLTLWNLFGSKRRSTEGRPHGYNAKRLHEVTPVAYDQSGTPAPAQNRTAVFTATRPAPVPPVKAAVDPADEPLSETASEVVSSEPTQPVYVPETAEPTSKVSPVRRRKQSQDYRGMFLVNRPTRWRRQVHISRELHDQISEFLPVISREMTITGFINNVMECHLRQYQDQINELYGASVSNGPVKYEKE
jgi:hypothetical protein